MTDRRAATVAMLIAVYLATGSAVAHADPVLIKCPDNTHVWNASQCENDSAGGPFAFPGTGGDTRGGGGLIGAIRRALGL